MSEVLLSLENVTMKFGGVTALGAVNLEVTKAGSLRPAGLLLPEGSDESSA